MTEYNFKNINPREALNAWEAQSFALLTTKGYPTSFKGVSEIMNDITIPADCEKAIKIVFWGRVWRQAKTKEEVTTAWNHILSAIKNSNFQSTVDYAVGKIASENDVLETNEVTLPVVERIAELKSEGLSLSEIILRGFKEDTVKKVFLK
jgi:hypothetical protein|tara:strand:+ start:5111 stop:5560 length:450 start_codon:yes stop_codon:yes gene_type:complete